MSIAIAAVGLASAQGNAADIRRGLTPRAAERWPWPGDGWSTSSWCRPAAGVSPGVNGLARWQALATLALTECLEGQTAGSKIPILVGSCNGGAHEFSAEEWRVGVDGKLLFAETPWGERGG